MILSDELPVSEVEDDSVVKAETCTFLVETAPADPAKKLGSRMGISFVDFADPTDFFFTKLELFSEVSDKLAFLFSEGFLSESSISRALPRFPRILSEFGSEISLVLPRLLNPGLPADSSSSHALPRFPNFLSVACSETSRELPFLFKPGFLSESKISREGSEASEMTTSCGLPKLRKEFPRLDDLRIFIPL